MHITNTKKKVRGREHKKENKSIKSLYDEPPKISKNRLYRKMRRFENSLSVSSVKGLIAATKKVLFLGHRTSKSKTLQID